MFAIVKFAVIIPDRRDRPKLLEHCLNQVSLQTIQPDDIALINFPATDGQVDITKRYQTGYDQLRGESFDAIFFIENDDFYHPRYFEVMLDEWNKAGRPDIFGTNYTIYYHIGLRKWFTMNHITRSSAMSTLIKPDLSLKWPVNHDPYTDIALWNQLHGITFHPQFHICMGIKHSIGLCGGENHHTYLHRYINDDNDGQMLLETVGEQNFKFYNSLDGAFQD